jgi:hypothetical protein
MQFDEVASLEVPRHRLRADPRQADLSIRIVRIYEIDVEGDLSVNTHGLNLLDQRNARAFEHIGSLLEARQLRGSDPRP